MNAVTIQGVSKRFGAARVLNDVSLEIRAGEIFGVIGPNGAGKTTLMGCLLGLLRPNSGEIRFAEGGPDSLAVRAVTGYMPERLNFERGMTGFQFVAYHHGLLGLPKATRNDDVERCLSRVSLQKAAWTKAIRYYSRGMLQRVGLAQAILGSPRYLLLDEPSSGVDPAGALEIREVLLELKRGGTTVFLNSHQLDQMERVCDRVAMFENGRVQSIEDLHAVDTGAKTLQVGWAFAPENANHRALEAATAAGAQTAAVDDGRGAFAVANEKVAAAVVKALCDAGFGVVSVTAAESRLERKFLKKDGGAA